MVNQAKLELRLERISSLNTFSKMEPPRKAVSTTRNSQIEQRRGFDDVGEGFAYGLVPNDVRAGGQEGTPITFTGG